MFIWIISNKDLLVEIYTTTAIIDASWLASIDKALSFLLSLNVSSKFFITPAVKIFGHATEHKTEKQANHNDVIHVTKWDNNFPKRIFFGKLHFGLSSGKKLLEGKNYGYVAISFNKNVTLELKKLGWERANVLQAIMGYMPNGEQQDI